VRSFSPGSSPRTGLTLKFILPYNSECGPHHRQRGAQSVLCKWMLLNWIRTSLWTVQWIAITTYFALHLSVRPLWRRWRLDPCAGRFSRSQRHLPVRDLLVVAQRFVLDILSAPTRRAIAVLRIVACSWRSSGYVDAGTAPPRRLRSSSARTGCRARTAAPDQEDPDRKVARCDREKASRRRGSSRQRRQSGLTAGAARSRS